MIELDSAGKPMGAPSGRLFWKFLFAFWLSLALTVSLIGSMLWLYQRPPPGSPAEISTTTRSALGIAAVAAILRYGGVETMREILEDRRRLGSLHVFVVDDQGEDLIGRPVSTSAMREAIRAAESDPEGHSAQYVTAPDGRSYLVFVPLAKTGLGGLRWIAEPFPPIELLLIGLVGWAGWSWLRFGRDPEYLDSESILMPAPPPGMSPAAAAVIIDGRSKRHALTTAMVELAARGEISFRSKEDDPTELSIDITVPDQRDGAGFKGGALCCRSSAFDR